MSSSDAVHDVKQKDGWTVRVLQDFKQAIVESTL